MTMHDHKDPEAEGELLLTAQQFTDLADGMANWASALARDGEIDTAAALLTLTADANLARRLLAPALRALEGALQPQRGEVRLARQVFGPDVNQGPGHTFIREAEERLACTEAALALLYAAGAQAIERQPEQEASQ